MPGALNDTWKWVENDMTLLTIPKGRPFRSPGRAGASHQDDGAVVDDRIECHAQSRDKPR